MSLYQVQKFIYQLNREPELQRKFQSDIASVLSGFELTADEERAIREPDIGLLYVMGVNGQILMHFAAFRGSEWSAYIEAMKEGERKYGPVRNGLYTSAESRL